MCCCCCCYEWVPKVNPNNRKKTKWLQRNWKMEYVYCVCARFFYRESAWRGERTYKKKKEHSKKCSKYSAHTTHTHEKKKKKKKKNLRAFKEVFFSDGIITPNAVKLFFFFVVCICAFACRFNKSPLLPLLLTLSLSLLSAQDKKAKTQTQQNCPLHFCGGGAGGRREEEVVERKDIKK